MVSMWMIFMWRISITYPSVHNCTSGRTTSEGRGPCSLRYASSSALARASRTASVSASCRLRSLELCAAALLRLMRSMRRCSFSSSVFARLRGGSVVLGSGSSCPHDFLFFAGLLWMMTGGGEACVDVPQAWSNAAGEGEEPLWRSSILRYCGGEGCWSMRSSRWLMGDVKWSWVVVAVSMFACLQAGSSVNGWSLGWSVRKRMVKRERQHSGSLYLASCPQRGPLPPDSAAAPGRGRAWPSPCLDRRLSRLERRQHVCD